jgi:hypothetical protein
MIIDVHAHLGYDRVFDHNFDEQTLLNTMNEFGVDFTILQPAIVHTLEEVREQHDAFAALASRHPGRFAGMANPNPHLPDDQYEAEVRRCIEQLGFVGIKIHTSAHGVNPAGRDGMRVFQLARELKVPVMVHTGAGIPFANPSYLMKVAEAYADVPIVMAHSGMMIMADETHLAMRRHDNLFADITWTGGFLIRSWIRELGAHRLMFGTDQPDNCAPSWPKSARPA